MQEEELVKKQEEELQYLNQRIKEISEKEEKVLAKEARTIAEFVEYKMKLLKTCYDKSDATVKESIHQLTRYPQLQCFLSDQEFSDTNRSRKVTLEDDIIYSERAVKIHIDKGIPERYKNRAIEFYSFYYGRYRLFFRCFGRDFLQQENIYKKFVDDIFSPKEKCYYTSKERLEITGATIIDKTFINEVRRKNFSMVEFYTAIQSENSLCQWYGVANDWDIEREDYGKLKQVITTSLNQKREYKVCGIVHGSGGSGKSTVLRRLCIDIQPIGNCTVVWISDVMQFYQHGISVIKQDLEANGNKKYVVVIEDWYRMFHNNTETGSKILKQLHENNNIRIVIGDRTIVGKPYENYGSDYNLLLCSNENKVVIEQIIKKYPDWQEASERLFESLNNDEPTLFLLLFILARISHENSGTTSVNLSDPLVVFKNIIKSDLNFISKQEEEKYQGLAKALYYWAYIYTEHKVSISYETFLMIANHYNGKNTTEISDLFSRWNADDEILDKLKIYINKDKNGLLQFNHDILAEGLSKLNIDGWKKFGTKIQLELLDVITDKGDNHSASVFLGTMLSKEERIFKNQEEKLIFVKRLILKSNHDQAYLYEFSKLQIDDQKLIEVAQLSWDNKNYDVNLWEKYFMQIKNDMIFKDNLFTILRDDNICEYNPEFISIILEYYKNINERNDFIDDILSDDKLKEAPAIITINFLKYATCETLYDFLKKRLQNSKGQISPYTTFRISLTYATKKVALELYKKILYEDDLKIINAQIIRECLYYVTYEIKQDFCKKILQNDYWKTIDAEITDRCLYYVTDEIKQDFCGNILQENNWQRYDCSLIYICLKCYENKTKIPKNVYNIIEYIISYSDEGSIMATNYLNLLKINFQQHPAWRKRTQKIIQNWETEPQEIVVNILLSHQVYPDKIYKICSELLTCWEKRFDKMKYFLNKDLYFEASLIIAMGHPHLRSLAKQTASEILKLRPLFYKDEFKSIITQIVENNIYPEWEI